MFRSYAAADPLRNAYLRRLIILYLDSLSLGWRRTYNLNLEGGGTPAFCLFRNVIIISCETNVPQCRDVIFIFLFFFFHMDSRDRIIDFYQEYSSRIYFILLRNVNNIDEAISNFVTHEVVRQARFKLTMNRDRVRFLSFLAKMLLHDCIININYLKTMFLRVSSNTVYRSVGNVNNIIKRIQFCHTRIHRTPILINEILFEFYSLICLGCFCTRLSSLLDSLSLFRVSFRNK